MSNFFYDAQIRRYLLQFIRIFADLSIEETRNGATVQERVPVLYGDPSRMVANILRNNSENTIMPSPAMSVWISGLEQAADRRQDMTHVSKKNINERARDSNGNYTDEIGNQYSLERLMPVPYTLSLQLDIWTTNTTTKMQIVEQIATWFNDRIQLQQNSNVYDWTSLFEVIMTGITWSNRGIPQGTESERDIASITFDLPIWLNPPAKLKTKRWIEQIVTNIKSVNDISDVDLDSRLLDPLGCFSNLSQVIISPDNIKLSVQSGPNGLQATLLDTNYNWTTLLQLHNLSQEQTKLYLKTDNNIDSDDGDIIADISFTENSNIANLTVDLDTVPGSTLPDVNEIVDPLADLPGGSLPAAAVGQRYIISSDIDYPNEPAINSVNGNSPWGALTAYDGDIVQYNGTKWEVVFESRFETLEVVNVLSTNDTLKFNRAEWIYLYQGEFTPGYWRIFGAHL